MVKRKLRLKSSSLLIIATLLVAVGFLSMSYALISKNITGENNYVIETGTLDIKIEGESDKVTLTDSYPMTDNEGKSLTPYKFTLTNDSNKPLSYSVNLLQETTGNDLNIELVRYYLAQGENTSGPENLSTTTPMYTGTINANSSLDFKLNIWLDYDATVEQAEGKTFKSKISITATQIIGELYSEGILNGTDPVLTDNLVPVQIDNTGKVTKADLKDKWYSYEEKQWANAVVLKTTTNYANGEEIPESNIESYFVWIPKYSYQLWDLGNYNSLTSNGNKQQEINIRFGTNNTSDLNNGECTTPNEAGMTGNCSIGKYMTHPAFLAFENSTGMWVGKFETGYRDATSTAGAQITSTDTSKIIIKPNVYSWRNNTVGNMFKLGYDYIREDESHMMKNTEWGAVAYLSHSAYGNIASLRINNNSSYITGYAATVEPTKGYNGGTSIDGNRVESTVLGTDGTYTVNYLNTKSQVASTTGNYSGIYDMSGGAWEYVMGYTTGSSIGVGGNSGITTLYSDFYTNNEWNKYYDKYSSTANTNYSNRILGDATGEMGPFFSEKDPDGNTRYKNSWYKDYADFASSASPWFERGGTWYNGRVSGAFAFATHTGAVSATLGFRVVLAPSTVGADPFDLTVSED